MRESEEQGDRRSVIGGDCVFVWSKKDALNNGASIEQYRNVMNINEKNTYFGAFA